MTVDLRRALFYDCDLADGKAVYVNNKLYHTQMVDLYNEDGDPDTVQQLMLNIRRVQMGVGCLVLLFIIVRICASTPRLS